ALQKHSFPKRMLIEMAEEVNRKLAGKDPGEPASRSGLRGATGSSSFYGNALCAMWRCDDLPSRRRLLVRGIAARPHARQCGGVPLPHLPAREDRIAADLRKTKRSVKLQSIWTEGPEAEAPSSARRAVTARATA